MRGYSAIGLISPKFGSNVGGVMRAAHCFEASMVMVQGHRDAPYTGRGDTPEAWKHMPILRVDDLFSHLPVGCETVAVDLVPDARDLRTFVHPERALYVFGPEDGTLTSEQVSLCTYKIMIPTRNCLNLAATVNVLLYDRLLKQK
jgi:tRNA(Leu) C34 or U34 (ribose-2'-O)-methylase TrmL